MKNSNWEMFLELLLVKLSSSEMSDDSGRKSTEQREGNGAALSWAAFLSVLDPFGTTEAMLP